MAYRRYIASSEAMLRHYDVYQRDQPESDLEILKACSKTNPSQHFLIKIQQFAKTSDHLARFECLVRAFQQGIILAEEIFLDEKTDYFEAVVIEPGASNSKHRAETLRSILKAGKMTFGQKQRMFQNIVATVSSLHTLGYPHLSLSPLSILIEDNSLVYLKAFAIPLQRKPEVYQYSAPEELFESSELNEGHGCDIWALGWIFAEIFVSLTPLFQAAGFQEMISRLFEVLGTPEFGEVEAYISYEIFESIRDQVDSRDVVPLGDRLYEMLPKTEANLLIGMLSFDPYKRPTCKEILESYYLGQGIADTSSVFPSQSYVSSVPPLMENTRTEERSPISPQDFNSMGNSLIVSPVRNETSEIQKKSSPLRPSFSHTKQTQSAITPDLQPPSSVPLSANLFQASRNPAQEIQSRIPLSSDRLEVQEHKPSELYRTEMRNLGQESYVSQSTTPVKREDMETQKPMTPRMPTPTPTPYVTQEMAYADNSVKIEIKQIKNLTLLKYNLDLTSSRRYYITLDYDINAAGRNQIAESIRYDTGEQVDVNWTKEFQVNSDHFKSIYRRNPLVINVYHGDQLYGRCEVHLSLLFTPCSKISNLEPSVNGWFHITSLSSQSSLGQLCVEVKSRHAFPLMGAQQEFVPPAPLLPNNTFQQMSPIKEKEADKKTNSNESDLRMLSQNLTQLNEDLVNKNDIHVRRISNTQPVGNNFEATLAQLRKLILES